MSSQTPFFAKMMMRFPDLPDLFFTICGSDRRCSPLILAYDGGSGLARWQIQLPPAGALLPSDLPWAAQQQPFAFSTRVVAMPGASNAYPFVWRGDPRTGAFSFAANPDVPNPEGKLSGWLGVLLGKAFWFYGWNLLPLAAITPAYDIVAPGLWLLRNALSNSFSNADYSWADISGEDYFRQTLPGSTWSHANLSGTNMNGADLRNASFVGALLAGTDFAGATLERCTFTGAASVAGAVFREAKLGGAALDGLDLSSLDFTWAELSSASTSPATVAGANLAGTKFLHAAIGAVDFKGVTSLRGADFTAANLNGARFDGLDLTGVVFSAAQLHGTSFIGCDLTVATWDPPADFSHDPSHRTILDRATLDASLLGNDWQALSLAYADIRNLPDSIQKLNATQAILTKISLPNMTLENASFDNAFLRGANFSNSDLSSASFRSAICDGDPANELDAAIFASSNLTDARFDDAQLTGADFSNAFLWGNDASLAHATIVLANFAGAFLAGIDLSGVRDRQCLGITFTGACLLRANLTGTSLLPYNGKVVSIANAALQGTIFTGANLDGADLTGAAVATESGNLAITAQPAKGFGPPKHIPYDATVAITPATTSTTICPDGEAGPCRGSKLVSQQGPVKSWPAQGGSASGPPATPSPGCSPPPRD